MWSIGFTLIVMLASGGKVGIEKREALKGEMRKEQRKVLGVFNFCS
jgi:hypothetical protein